MKIHDLSVTLREDMDVFPGDPPFRARAAAVFDRDGCNVTDLSMGTHTGTHIDVPRHFLRDGAPWTRCRWTVLSGTPSLPMWPRLPGRQASST